MSFNDRVVELRKLLSLAKHPVVFFDSDTDGTTSYLQLKRVFPNIEGVPILDRGDKLKQVNYFKYVSKDHDLVLFIDIPFLNEEFLKLLMPRTILWADHHILPERDILKKYNIRYLNPLDYDIKDNRPSSFLAYSIANSKANLDLVSIGSLADFFLLPVLKDWNEQNSEDFDSVFQLPVKTKKLLLEFLETYTFNDPKVKDKRSYWINEIIYKYGLFQLRNIFDFVYKFDSEEKVNRALRILEQLSVRELFEKIKLGKGFLFSDYAKFTLEYTKLLQTALATVKDSKLVMYEYIGLRPYSKTLSEELCYRLKNWELIMIFFKNTNEDIWRGSLRSKSIHIPNLLTECLVGLEGEGGGHANASGCRVKNKDFEEFKKRVTDKIN